MPIPSHLNHSRAPNTKPEPSNPLVSQQRTPKHSDSLASSRRIPDPTLFRPFLFLTSSRFPTTTLIPDPTPFNLLCSCVKSIPDISSVSRLWSGEARSRTSLTRRVLVCPFLLSIYLYVPLSHHSLPFVCFLCLILSSLSPSTLVSSIFILTSVDPTLVIPYIPYDPFPIIQINPILTTPALV